MKILGITGGSGTGKTTVSNIFRRLGVPVIDADIVAHEITEKGQPALKEIHAFFGNGVINSDGTLNRKALGNIVFSNQEKLQRLNAITHGYITQRIEVLLLQTDAAIVGIDGAVLIESGIAARCDYICSVLADQKIRKERIKIRDGLTEEQAQCRILSQKQDEFYIEHSSFLVYNNTEVIHLETQVKKIINQILESN